MTDLSKLDIVESDTPLDKVPTKRVGRNRSAEYDKFVTETGKTLKVTATDKEWQDLRSKLNSAASFHNLKLKSRSNGNDRYFSTRKMTAAEIKERDDKKMAAKNGDQPS